MAECTKCDFKSPSAALVEVHFAAEHEPEIIADLVEAERAAKGRRRKDEQAGRNPEA